MHRTNDPNTYNTKDSYKRLIEQLANKRAKDVKKLSETFDKLEAAFNQFEILNYYSIG